MIGIYMLKTRTGMLYTCNLKAHVSVCHVILHYVTKIVFAQ